jgi:energy-coupling factor transporter ATP-binding protein EcfA2
VPKCGMWRKKGETSGVRAGHTAEPEEPAPWSKGAKKKRTVRLPIFHCMPALCTRAQVRVLNAARARQEMRDSPSDGRGGVWEDNGATPAAGPIPGPRARGAVSKKDQVFFLLKKREAKRQRPPRAEEDAVQGAHAGRRARVHEEEEGDQELATDDGDEPGDAGESRGGEKEGVSDASESESNTQSTGCEGEGKDDSAAVLPTSPDVVGDQMLAVSPAKKQVVDGWQPGEKSVLATGVDGELIIVLSPWETIHLVGSVRVLVLAGSCTVFGARLSGAATVASGAASGIGGAATAGSFHDVHAVPPYGPMGLEAAGRATSSAALDRSAMARHGVGATGRDSLAAQRHTVDELEAELSPSRPLPVACVLCLRRWRQERGDGAAGDSLLTWLKGRGLDLQIRTVLGGGRILFPWSACLLQPLKVSSEWSAAADRVSALSSPGSVAAVVGAKGAGKSTLLRYLVNRLLLRHQEVWVLDGDVGQAEFTPGGLLSVTSVTRPVLGPPHTHCVGTGVEGLQLVQGALMGDVTPESDPDRYKACVTRMCEFVSQQAAARKVPVLVNSCGWVKGLGMELLSHLLEASAASLVLVCQVGNARKDIQVPTNSKASGLDPSRPGSKRAAKRRGGGSGTFDSNSTPLGSRNTALGADGDCEEEDCMQTDMDGMEEFEEEDVSQVPWGKHVQVLPIPPTVYTGERASINSAELRSWQTLSYLGSAPYIGEVPSSITNTLWALTPVEVALDALRLHFLDTSVPASQVLVALNGTLVGLCVTPPEGRKGLEECVGLGLVRQKFSKVLCVEFYTVNAVGH